MTNTLTISRELAEQLLELTREPHPNPGGPYETLRALLAAPSQGKGVLQFDSISLATYDTPAFRSALAARIELDYEVVEQHTHDGGPGFHSVSGFGVGGKSSIEVLGRSRLLELRERVGDALEFCRSISHTKLHDWLAEEPGVGIDDIFGEADSFAADEQSAVAAVALSAEEMAFLRLIVSCPGSKLNGGEAFNSDGEDMWSRLEAIGLIESVGSYKWKPAFDAIELGIRARLDNAKEPIQ